MKTESDRRGISFEIDKNSGKIMLKGQDSDVNEIYIKVKETLFAARKEKEDAERAKMHAEWVS